MICRAARIAPWLFAAAAVAACKKERPTVYPVPAQTYGPPPAAAPPPASAPAPVAAAPGASPAAGFPCAGDQDLQCPFGRCIAGRCGGCSSAVECKPGAQCGPTLFGSACLPGAPVAQPTGTPPPVPPSPSPAPGAVPDSTERARALCVQRTNEYRARTGAAALQRRPDREACSDTQARSDGQSRRAHGAFGQCAESAQNECPAWSGSLESVIDRCWAMMFAEGPGPGPEHGHYTNMTNRTYAGVACGVSVSASGEVWIVQNFYR